ncbi:MAG: RloB domain-containing protein, partial [Okeania sp. SIO2H7]|nr:RloB domain-containing protein [Okeania sp. SIO2H7]
MARSKRQNKRSKKTNSRGYLDRNKTVKTRETIQRFLIVCEGEKTEPNYFKSFRVPGNVEIIVLGLGENPIKLVKEAMEMSKKEEEYDQVWCVFDRDDWEPNDFNGAITCAEKNEIKIAYSNEAFELWYLLHFYYRDTAMSRKSYKGELTKKLREAKLISNSKKYEKNSEEMYGFLEDKQSQAIKN